MSADTLLLRLDRVKQTGAGRSIAACPAHEDKSPSLSIRELDDGRILLHCFSCNDTQGVLAAIGLTMADLFPEPISHHAAGVRPNHWHAAREALRVLKHEVLLVAVAAENIAAGLLLTPDDRERVIQAAIRIRAASEACQ